MAQGDVIEEVFNSEGKKTGVSVKNATKGTVREIWRNGKTIQSSLQMAPARNANPRNNPRVAVRRAVTRRR